MSNVFEMSELKRLLECQPSKVIFEFLAVIDDHSPEKIDFRLLPGCFPGLVIPADDAML